MRKFILKYGLVSLLALGCKTTHDSGQAITHQILRVSLYSAGQGTDIGAFHAINHTIKKYRRKGININYTNRYWGKEGEVDYCFDLNHLDSVDYQAFYNELDSLLKDRMVHIYIDQQCIPDE